MKHHKRASVIFACSTYDHITYADFTEKGSDIKYIISQYKEKGTEQSALPNMVTGYRLLPMCIVTGYASIWRPPPVIFMTFK